MAYLIFSIGVLRVAMGFWGAAWTADMDTNRAFASRYLGAATTGEAISEGMMYLLVAVALGVLCEISTGRNRPDERV